MRRIRICVGIRSAAEWVAYATHRQNRTFLPPPDYNPLAPSTSPEHPTEVPAGAWDVAVFENLFPTLAMTALDPPALTVPTSPARGVCEVVVFTQDPAASLGTLPLWHLELLLEVWADRYAQLGALPEVEYVYPFENRGVEVGVTLNHPHGQIYAYPFVPPVPARELSSSNGRTTSGMAAAWSKTWSPAKSRSRAACFIRDRTRRPSCRSARATRMRSGWRRIAAGGVVRGPDAPTSAETSRGPSRPC